MELEKDKLPIVNNEVSIVITDRYGKDEVKQFVFTDDLWYVENRKGLYSFDFDMNLDWGTKTRTCSSEYLKVINHWVKKVGLLKFCVCGEHGVTVFVHTYGNKELPNYSYIESWFKEKHNMRFVALSVNKYKNDQKTI